MKFCLQRQSSSSAPEEVLSFLFGCQLIYKLERVFKTTKQIVKGAASSNAGGSGTPRRKIPSFYPKESLYSSYGEQFLLFVSVLASSEMRRDLTESIRGRIVDLFKELKHFLGPEEGLSLKLEGFGSDNDSSESSSPSSSLLDSPLLKEHSSPSPSSSSFGQQGKSKKEKKKKKSKKLSVILSKKETTSSSFESLIELVKDISDIPELPSFRITSQFSLRNEKYDLGVLAERPKVLFFLSFFFFHFFFSFFFSFFIPFFISFLFFFHFLFFVLFDFFFKKDIFISFLGSSYCRHNYLFSNKYPSLSETK